MVVLSVYVCVSLQLSVFGIFDGLSALCHVVLFLC